MAKPKPIFAAIPARAYGDPRLKGLHHRVLGVVALHDRMSAARKNGQGCWAGNKRLAELIGCDYSRLSATLSDLATWGYIDSRTNPMNKTRRILFVVYDERDDAFMTASHVENPLPTGKQSAAENSLPTGEDDLGIVCSDFQNFHEYQALGGGEYIPQKRGRDSAEAGKEDSAEAGINSVETASPFGEAKDSLGNEGRKGKSEHNPPDKTGQFLGKVQTWLKALSHRQLTDEDIQRLRQLRDECLRIEDESEAHLGGTGGWAQRLGSDIDYLIDDPDDGEEVAFCQRFAVADPPSMAKRRSLKSENQDAGAAPRPPPGNHRP